MSEQILISTGRSTREKKYHTGMCRAAKKANNLREVSPEVAETMDLDKCPYCAGTHVTDNYNDKYQKILQREAEKHAAKAGGD